MKIFCFALLCVITHPASIAQSAESWIHLSKEKWPQIALINQVEYKNGDTYLDPSYPYAGIGFLIEYEKDTFAATAKHVLWIARNKKSNSVAINDALRSWVMKVKGSRTDSAVIDKLLNEDTSEVLEGALSTITERDAIFFSVKNISPAIYPLKPRFTPMQPGEKVFFISNAYADSVTTVYEGKVLQKLGIDILIERDMSTFRGGASGSPIIDANGHLVAITSTAGNEGKSGKDVAVGISMEYFRDVMAGKTHLNKPKINYGELIYESVMKNGVKKAIQQYHAFKKDPQNYYVYNLRSANRNGLRETGEKLIQMKHYKQAIEILQLNIEENTAFFGNYNVLAKAYLLSGNKAAAIRNYQRSTEKFNDPEENEAFRELKKLQEN